MSNNVEYKFIGLQSSTSARGIELVLTQLASEDWRVVSHTDDTGEWSFVLVRTLVKPSLFQKLKNAIKNL